MSPSNMRLSSASFLSAIANLNKVVVFNYGKEKLNGYVLYFDKMATCQFEEIINNLFMYK